MPRPHYQNSNICNSDFIAFSTRPSRFCHDLNVFATRVLRLYYVHGDATTLVLRPSRPYCALTAFQVRSPNLGVCFEHAQNKRRDSAIICDHGDHSTMSGVSTALLLRLWRPWHALGPFSIAVEAQ